MCHFLCYRVDKEQVFQYFICTDLLPVPVSLVHFSEVLYLRESELQRLRFWQTVASFFAFPVPFINNKTISRQAPYPELSNKHMYAII